jgi:muramoyltetrapeptide carboxypeptidase
VHLVALGPGAILAIVAPSGPLDPVAVGAGLAWLRTRYRLRMDPRIFRREGYFAGTDEERVDVLARAMRDPDVSAILCARGGYGTMRLLDALPWDVLAEQRKPIVGFSDITALHLMANARGVATIHGPNVGGLGRAISPCDRAAFLDALEGRAPPRWTDLEPLRAGDAEGPAWGGNLALVYAMSAAGRLVVPKDAIVFFEDIHERPYQIDRMLTALGLAGHFARASAIVFGTFSDCGRGEDGVTVPDVLRTFAASYGRPVVMGAPFGHTGSNRAFVLGRPARLEKNELRFSSI